MLLRKWSSRGSLTRSEMPRRSASRRHRVPYVGDLQFATPKLINPGLSLSSLRLAAPPVPGHLAFAVTVQS